MVHFEEINSLGGNNTFLATLFISAAGAGVLIQVIFLALYVFKITNNPEFYEIENTKW